MNDVLCIPIFKSFIDCVDILLFNLDHIFKKSGLEVIDLQPAIVNSLKEIKDEGNYFIILFTTYIVILAI